MHTQAKKKNHLGGQLFLLVLMGVTFYVIFKGTPLSDILAALKDVKIAYIGLAALVMAASVLFQALALGAPFREFGRRVSLWRKLEYALTGIFFSAVTPSSTGGQPMQIYYMCRDNLRVSQVSISMLLSNLAYQSTVLLFGVGMFVAKYAYVTERLSGFGALVFFGIVMNMLLMTALLFALFSKRFASAAVDRCITLLAKLRIVKDEEGARARGKAARGIQDMRRRDPHESALVPAALPVHVFADAHAVYDPVFYLQGLFIQRSHRV